jgi:hypothetical protein
MVPNQLFYGLVIIYFCLPFSVIGRHSYGTLTLCIDLPKSIFIFSGVLSEITIEIPPLQQIKHSFCLHFLVPGEYTLLAAAVIDDANDILRARARASSAAEPIFCRGPPYHLRVLGNA